MRADASAVAIPLSSLSDQRSSDGAVRWYAVHVPAGREASFAEKCRKALDPALLEDCIAPRYERYVKRGGVWRIETAPLFAEYVFVATRDAEALAKALGRLSFAAPIVGRRGRVRAARGRSAVVAGVDARRLARPTGERGPHRPGSAHGRTRSAQRKRADRPQDRSSQALGVRGPWRRRRGVSSEGGFERAVEELTSDDEGSRPVRARLLIDLGLFAGGSPGGIAP